MSNIFILNASPIILLGKAGLLKTISPLADKWIVPEKVVAEVEVKRSVAPYLAELSVSSRVFNKSTKQTHPSIASWNLGPGESEVLTLGMQTTGASVVLDDLLARKCALLFDIPLIGSIGLLVKAKRTGHIKLVRPEIEKLVNAGMRIDTDLLHDIYLKIGENNDES